LTARSISSSTEAYIVLSGENTIT